MPGGSLANNRILATLHIIRTNPIWTIETRNWVQIGTSHIHHCYPPLQLPYRDVERRKCELFSRVDTLPNSGWPMGFFVPAYSPSQFGRRPATQRTAWREWRFLRSRLHPQWRLVVEALHASLCGSSVSLECRKLPWLDSFVDKFLRNLNSSTSPPSTLNPEQNPKQNPPFIHSESSCSFIHSNISGRKDF